MHEVYASDEFDTWYHGLDDADRRRVTFAVDLLEERGVLLGHPYSSAIKGTKFPFRELRVQSEGRPIRIIYAYDPQCDAYLIIGGDKTGDDRFYKHILPLAQRIWTDYLANMEGD